jgi:histidinol phosphatase-like PHP family hydrolase
VTEAGTEDAGRGACVPDLHIHTVFSRDVKDPGQTLGNIARLAAAKGISPIGFADHYHPGFLVPEDHEMEEARAFVSERDGAEPARLGIEASILDRHGRISVEPEGADRFDYVIASMHPNFPGVEPPPSSSVDAFLGFLQKAYMNAVLNPLVDVIGHPWNLHAKSVYDNSLSFWGICRALGLSPAACFDRIPDSWFGEFARAAKEGGKAVEMNAYGVATRDIGPRYGEDPVERGDFGAGYLRLYRILVSAGVRISVGSDAHARAQLGDTLLLAGYFDILGLRADGIWIPPAGGRSG